MALSKGGKQRSDSLDQIVKGASGDPEQQCLSHNFQVLEWYLHEAQRSLPGNWHWLTCVSGVLSMKELLDKVTPPVDALVRLR